MKKRFASILDMNYKKRVKILLSIFFLIILMAGMLISCSTEADDAKTPSSSSNENQKKNDTIIQEDHDSQTEITENNSSLTIKTDSGSYVGQADNNSIEIRISGVQDDEMAFRVFKISEEVRLAFESLSLNKDDQVKFSYYEKDIGQPVLVKIERISN